jgi:hypothetical protein
VKTFNTQTRQETDMATPRRHDDDDNNDVLKSGILQDQKVFRSSMMAKDSSFTPVQRAIMAATQQRDTAFSDAAAHRSGFRYSSSDAARSTRQQAYDAYERDMSEAWRGNKMDDADTPVGAYREDPTTRAGDQCTTDGRPGTLQPVAGRDGWLQCRPTKSDAMPVNDSREQAYVDYQSRLENAWRSPS